MDEKKLAELLKDAVADAPPPTFTHGDVTRESERQRVRHRNGLLAGSAFGVAVLAGATALGVALWTGQEMPSQATSAESVASSGNGNAAPYELPDEDADAAAPTQRREEDQGFPPETPSRGGPSDGNGGPAGPTSTPSGCEQADRELAAALAGELPAAANIKVDDALPVTTYCPSGATGASYDLTDGRLSVLLVPADEVSVTSSEAGGVQATAPTGDGRQVLVVSEPLTSRGSAPYGSDLARIAEEIARLY
jgi:hypothetical protein